MHTVLSPSFPTCRFSRRALLLLALLLSALGLAGCDQTLVDPSDEAARDRLIGYWLRDYDEGPHHVRRLLVLLPDGKFRETVRAVDAEGKVSELANKGEWWFDGTNLKRRYLLMDGKAISAPFTPFATFELKFESNREFIGLDRVHKRSVRYQRVNDGTVL